jgi:glycosyltransferase involved in cell wall biosynthesis
MGIDDLIVAWRAVVDRLPDARLDIVGSGPMQASLVAQSDALGLQNSITFHGRVSDAALARLYETARFSVVPSRTLEGFGLIVLESLAHGTPVVATDCGGLPEILESLDRSLIVPTRAPDRLAERLIDAYRGQLPSRSQCRLYAAQYSWSTLANRHSEVITRLLAGPA